ncbi:MAG: surface lipoprotein assembly modifier [Paracoccaceae bacterium]
MFDNVRHDLEWIASAGIRNSNVSYFGFTPTLRYTYQNRKSTVSLNTIQSHDLFFGISIAF